MNRQSQKLVDERWMTKALELAVRGEGHVEPNPMVGCVIVNPDSGNGELVGQGYHQKFGSAHAEVEALKDAGENAKGSTVYVTLEPCSHTGKTGPCADALIAAKVARVVIAVKDPFREVSGRGIQKLKAAGIEVATGIGEAEAKHVLAPYLKRIETGLPWIIAKWAMTWDGKIATASGDSKWISNEHSRAVTHGIRGRVDAIMVGSKTAANDDPLLTARPAGPKTALRVVVDSSASLSLDSQLAKTAKDVPVLLCSGNDCRPEKVAALKDLGVEVWQGDEVEPTARLATFLRELAERGVTNILVEGGGALLGSLSDARLIDEVHCFLGPRLLGGAKAVSPVGGNGADKISEALSLANITSTQLGDDIYLTGRVVNRRRQDRH